MGLAALTAAEPALRSGIRPSHVPPGSRTASASETSIFRCLPGPRICLLEVASGQKAREDGSSHLLTSSISSPCSTPPHAFRAAKGGLRIARRSPPTLRSCFSRPFAASTRSRSRHSRPDQGAKKLIRRADHDTPSARRSTSSTVPASSYAASLFAACPKPRRRRQVPASIWAKLRALGMAWASPRPSPIPNRGDDSATSSDQAAGALTLEVRRFMAESWRSTR